MRCHTDCIERRLGNLFYSYGKFVARYPVPFIILPVLISAGLGVGFMNLKEAVSDLEYLYTPSNGPAKTERDTIEKYFPVNYSGGFLQTRRQTIGGSVVVILAAKDGGNILREEHYEEVLNVEQMIHQIVFHVDDEAYAYSDVCALFEEECVYSSLPRLLPTVTTITEWNITYPTWQGRFIPATFGGVETSNDIISAAKVIKMSFFLKYGSSLEIDAASVFMEAFVSNMSTFQSSIINAHYRSSDSLGTELDGLAGRVIPKFAVTYTIIINFAIFSCVMLDPIRSKPWLAFIGVASVGMAIVSTFGLITLAGVEFITMVANMPFLILGIGVDDMFIMIAAWRQTDPNQPVTERTGHAMKEAAMSITITSLTDGLAFAIGAITPFPAVRIFCIFCGTAILIDYVYQITFFAAFLSLFGKREAENRHAWTCMVLPTKDTAQEERALLKRQCCVGGYYQGEDEKRGEPGLMIFFNKYFGPFLMKPVVKACFLFLYGGYLAVAVWGCTQVREGLELKNLAPDDSYLISYHNLNDEYFGSKLGLPVMLAFTDTLHYWDKNIQNDIEHITSKYENDDNFQANGVTDSWLRNFLAFTNVTNTVIKSRTSFLNALNTFLHTKGFSQYAFDIQFSSDMQLIVSSRIVVQSQNLANTDEQKHLMLRARKLAADSKMSITVYHPAFIFIDQFAAVVNTTLQNIGAAGACMLVIALLLVPNPMCALWVALTIISIDGGVVGFMTLWGANLDMISMVNIILCIGFSVDFSAHIAYSFVSSAEETKDKRAIAALHHLGMPILQGTLSTVLAIMILSTSDTYIFRTFFKTMFLVMVLGAFHGLIILPILLSLIGPGRQLVQNSPESQKKEIIISYKKNDECKLDADNEAFPNPVNS